MSHAACSPASAPAARTTSAIRPIGQWSVLVKEPFVAGVEEQLKVLADRKGQTGALRQQPLDLPPIAAAIASMPRPHQRKSVAPA